MQALFLSVLNMSLAAILVVLLVLLLRALFGKRMPRRFICLLWTAVFARLAVPAYLPAPFSLFGLSAMGTAAERVAPRVEPASAYLPLVRLDYVPPLEAVPASGEALQAISFLTAAAWAWAGVAVCALLFFLAFYLRVFLRLRTATRFPDEALPERCAKALRMRRRPRVYISSACESPIVFGLFFPRVILPAALAGMGDQTALEQVLTHELAHVRRLDSLVKPAMLLIACAHWFNPFAWLAFFLAARDLELACDEWVLRAAPTDIRGSYANTLLRLAVKDTALSRFGLPAFGESAVKSRIKSIVRYRKTPFWVSAGASVLVAVVLLGALSNPAFAFALGEAPPLVREDFQAVPEDSGIEAVWVPYAEFPQRLIDAVTAMEDRRFFSHNGVDWKRTGAAAVNLFVAREGIFPSSTITQQLVRMTTGENQVTVERKLREINLALQMESCYSKQEILEAYLNQCYYANGIYGIGNASMYYYSRPINELSLAELCSLVVIPQYPTRYDPVQNPEDNRARRNDLLHELGNMGLLSMREVASAMDAAVYPSFLYYRF